jgi:DNA-binding GntR family transcriptional regulator
MLTPTKLPALKDTGVEVRQVTMGARVYELLRQAIIQLQLRPGDPLSEAQVAEQLGVSRQPVREAFIKLAETGLVEIRPQRGTFVRLISIRDVTNAQFLRDAIEVAVVARAATRADAAGAAGLNGLVAAQARAAGAGDHVLFLRLDEEFHQAISRLADCRDAWRVLEGLKSQMDRVRYLSLSRATPMEALVAQHAGIAAAIARHDPADAGERMRLHLAEILRSLPLIAAENADLFAD